MHKVIAAWGAIVATVCFANASAKADVTINVDRSHQRMHVSVNGMSRYTWSVSTGRAGFSTPNGVYAPKWLARKWFSRKYYNAPMPYSIFFHEGYAIHGSTEIARLGGPASHGCVRLHPKNAATLFALVQSQGATATTIVVSGGMPSGGRRHIARSDGRSSPLQADQGVLSTPARVSRGPDGNRAEAAGWGLWGRASIAR
jgi:L,D-transpeptidase catalytic domain